MFKKFILTAVATMILLTAVLAISGCGDADALRRQIADLQQKQGEQAGRIAGLEEALMTQVRKVEELKAEIRAKDARILELEEQIDRQITEFAQELSEQTDKIAELEAELTAKNGIIAELEEELRLRTEWGHYYDKHRLAVAAGYERSIPYFVATLLGDGGDKDDKSDAALSAYEVYIKHHADYTRSEADWLEDLVGGQLKTLFVFEIPWGWQGTLNMPERTYGVVTPEDLALMSNNDSRLLAIEIRNEIMVAFKKRYPGIYTVNSYLGSYDNYVMVRMGYNSGIPEVTTYGVVYLLG